MIQFVRKVYNWFRHTIISVSVTLRDMFNFTDTFITGYENINTHVIEINYATFIWC